MKQAGLMVLLSLGLSLSSVLALAAGDPAAGKAKSTVCAACHGADGNSADPANPKLAGQHEAYLYAQLKAFKPSTNAKGEQEPPARENAIMAGQVASLSDQDMQDLAAYFASQTIQRGISDKNLVELGRKIYRGGNTATDVSACTACHGPRGEGNPAAKFPALAGQHPQYTAAQLRAFRAGKRTNDAGKMMQNVTARMTDEEIDAVAAYLSSLH